MATLTSTGAVNLTSSTNWSPAQIPAAGDDLVIAGAHTLTLDADFTGAGALNTVNFQSNSSKMAISGTSRTVQATNGWTANSNNSNLGATVGPGTSVTLIGKWTFTLASTNTFYIINSTGGNVTYQTVGADPSAVLFETLANYVVIIATSWTAGTLTTIGRFNIGAANATSVSVITMSGGTWIHQSTGTNVSGQIQPLVSATGSGTIQWSGSLDAPLASNTAAFIVNTSSITNTIGISGNRFRCTGNGLAGVLVGVVVRATAGKVALTGDFVGTNKGQALWLNGGTIDWKSQSPTVQSGESCIAHVTSGTLDISDLALSNSGQVAIIEHGTGAVTTNAGTTITCQSTNAKAMSNNTTVSGKIVTLPSPTPTLPVVQNVAAGTSYGYAATPLTGTGLIMDPAILATAVRNGVNVTVNPLVGALSGRVLSDMTMNFFKGEVINTTITVVDSSRQPVNMSGMTLRLVFENATTGTDIASVTSFTITGAGSNNATFAVPSAVTNTVTSTPHVWSLRDTGDGNRVIAMGTVVVRAAASLD